MHSAKNLEHIGQIKKSFSSWPSSLEYLRQALRVNIFMSYLLLMFYLLVIFMFLYQSSARRKRLAICRVVSV